MDNSQTFTMRQASQELGVSTKLLRKYCNQGVVPRLKHTMGRHRIFTTEQLEWLRVAVWLHRAGFTLPDLRKYMRLAQDTGQKATQERLAMVRTHKRQVWQELEDLQATIDFLERQEELLAVDD